jgi:hypothetical protein
MKSKSFLLLTILGSTFMGSRIFCATSGNITDEMIMEYIETQDDTIEDDENFTVTG